jgi:hypothetical protein
LDPKPIFPLKIQYKVGSVQMMGFRKLFLKSHPKIYVSGKGLATLKYLPSAACHSFPLAQYNMIYKLLK